METTHREQGDERSGRVFVVSAVAFVALVGAYFALGMPGMNHPGTEMADMDHISELQALSPRAFEARVAQGDAFVVNVHVPARETIDGTTDVIAFDAVVASERLPADKTTPILLYCESGRMSETAGIALLRAGYLDVAHLTGGLVAWRQADLPLSREPLAPQ